MTALHRDDDSTTGGPDPRSAESDLYLTRPIFEPGDFSRDDPQFEIEVMIGVSASRLTSTSGEHVDLSQAKLIWSGTGRPIEIRGSAHDHMTPVKGNGRDLCELLQPALWRQGGETRLRLKAHLFLAKPGEAVGFRAELMRNDELVATGDVVYQLPWPTALYLSTHDFFPLDWKISSPRSLLPDDRWEIRLKSDPRVAIRDLDDFSSTGFRTRYIEFECAVPVEELQSERWPLWEPERPRVR